jgi:hemerythrin superfamily protein
MKATSLLKQQHREVESLFQAIESGEGELLERVEDLADALVAHMAIEHELFYPAARDAAEDLVLEAFEEHASAEVALKRLLATDLFDPSFKAKVLVLKELVLHHVEEEEGELFPKVEAALGDDANEELGAEMEALFEEALQEGHEAALGRRVPKTTADAARIRVTDASRESSASL